MCNNPKYLRDVPHEMKTSMLTCKSDGGDEQSYEQHCHRHLTGDTRLRLRLKAVTCRRRDLQRFCGGTEGSNTLQVQAVGPKGGFSSFCSRVKGTFNATSPYRATAESTEPHSGALGRCSSEASLG